MKPQRAFEEWIETPGVRDYVQSAEYARRVKALGDRLEKDDLTVEQAAEIAGVPVAPFIWILSNYLAAEAARKKLN